MRARDLGIHGRLTVEDHTCIIQAVKFHRKQIIRRLGLRLGQRISAVEVFLALLEVKGLEEETKGALAIVIRGVPNYDASLRQLTTGQLYIIEQTRKLMDAMPAPELKIAALEGLVRNIGPTTNLAAGIRVAIEIIEDGLGKLYPSLLDDPSPPTMYLETAPDAEPDIAVEGVQGAISGGILEGVSGAILGAIVDSGIAVIFEGLEESIPCLGGTGGG